MDITSTLFSPINSKDYCGYFYGLEVIYFILFIGGVITMVVGAYHKKLTLPHYAMGIMGLMFKFIMYAECRLLYSMCVV